MGKRGKVHPSNGLHMSLFEPESNWTPPESYPDLSSAKKIAIDLETRDPNLQTKGPGGVRNDGEIIGVCVATDTGFSGYYPIAHLSGGNVDRDITLRWLDSVVSNPAQVKVGANIIYDLEWLAASGIEVLGPVHDVQIIEGLLDEEGSYSLDYLSRKYLKIPKRESLLYEAATAFGIDPKKELWKLHSKYVGPYGEGDALNTLKVYEKQLPLIQNEGLEKIFELESALTPIILKMRMQGVRIDIEKAEALDARLKKDFERGVEQLASTFHRSEINIWSADDLVAICDACSVEYAMTAKGNPSFTKDWLKTQENKWLKEVTRLRTLDRLRGTFIREKIINASHNGRVHSQFKQMPSDDGGTRTGRFASANPNLQQVPSRDELAPLIRGLFIPESGEKWAKLDYSQQEPRIAVHYSLLCKLNGAQQAKEAYERGEDIYEFITKAAGITRRQAKDLTLGRMYGMGPKKMAERLHTTDEEAKAILEAFDASAPFLKKLSDKVESAAKKKGFIETVGGRHRHFELYAPVGDRKAMPLKLDSARVRYGDVPLERWGCHKALNSLIQGSAADMTKQAMLNIYNETGQVPLMQVHDEINYSVRCESEALVFKELCEQAIQLEVPVVCDLDYGDSWK